MNKGVSVKFKAICDGPFANDYACMYNYVLKGLFNS